jgi:uncharacterized protein
MRRPSEQFTRRSFLRNTIAAAAATAALSRSAVTLAQSHPRGKFVDVHTHIGQTWNNTEPLTADALLKWMDEHEIAQSVVLPLVSPESSSYLTTVDYVLAETRPHRDRLVPFCCVDPRTSYTGGRHGLRAMIRKWMDAGAKGFGEHKCGVPIDFAGSQEIYTVCGELKLPILFHLDEQRNTDVPGLPGLEKMLKTYKDTTFIGHGPGWWASLSGDVTAKELGGYPKTKVVSGGAMERLLDTYPNIYCDFSAGSGSGALARDMEFAKGFITRRQDRLMFGTDYLAPGQQVPQFETFAKLDLPQDVQAKIFRDNARRLIGF